MNDVEIWRVRKVLQSRNSSSGDWALIEGRKEMLTEVFKCSVEAAAHFASDREDSRRIRSWWMRFVRPEDSDAGLKVASVRVDQLVRGEWVEMDVEFLPPRVDVRPREEQQ